LQWRQLDWLLLQRQVLTLRFRSELGLEAMAIPAIMGITLIAITDRIRTMATIMGLRTTGTAGIVTITATIVIITTDLGTKPT
jgi:predicted nucleic acid-binding protein